jgi:hypothetical protein
MQTYLRWLRRDVDPAWRLCEAGVPAWAVHADKGDGGLTQHERAVLEAWPHVRVVTVPGQVFFLPNEVPERIADVIVQALAAARAGRGQSLGRSVSPVHVLSCGTGHVVGS